MTLLPFFFCDLRFTIFDFRKPQTVIVRNLLTTFVRNKQK